MGRKASKYQEAFTRRDARKIERALAETSLAREHDRLQTLRLLTEGYSVVEIATALGFSRPTVYRIADRYLTGRLVESVVDQPRSGRPLSAPAADAELIQATLEKSPRELGYRCQSQLKNPHSAAVEISSPVAVVFPHFVSLLPFPSSAMAGLGAAVVFASSPALRFSLRR